MKRKIILLLLLSIIFIMFQIVLGNSKSKFSITYEINDFLINEDYNSKIKNGYYLNIIYNDNVFSYQFHSDNIGKKIITDIKYYKDRYSECILPIFNGDIIFDIMCTSPSESSNGIYYQYLHNMENVSEGLKEFAASITNYNVNKFIDISSSSENGMYDIYTENIIKDFSIETYRGIINNMKKVDLFNDDKYKKLSVYTDNYYVVPDYETDYEFNNIYIVNIKNSKVKKLKFNYSISYSSYIQGVDGDIIYLFDLENKIQYKIDCKKQDITKIGSLNNNIKIYSDGVWTEKSVSEIVDLKPIFDFKRERITLNNNSYMDTVNDFIYTYIKTDAGYEVYKSNKYTPNLKNYLFSISDIDNIIYDGDYFYFKKDNYIGYYSEQTGIKKIIQGNELLFNNNILFNIIL